MSGNRILIDAADVAPPTSVFVRTTVTSSERLSLVALAKKFVTFQAETSDVYVAFGTGSVSASASATSTVSSEVASAASGGTVHIKAGTERTFRIPSAVTHCAHISADTSGKFRFFDSTGPGEM